MAFEVEPFGLDIILVQPGAYKTKIISDVEFLRPEGTAYGPFIDQVKKAGKGHLEAVARDPQEVFGGGQLPREVLRFALCAHHYFWGGVL